MEVGSMNNRIDFRQNQTVIDPETKLPSEGYVIIYSCWAKIEYLKGREYYKNEAVHVVNTVKFTIRYKEDLTPDLMIFFKGKKYNIDSIMPDYTSKKETVIITEEVE